MSRAAATAREALSALKEKFGEGEENGLMYVVIVAARRQGEEHVSEVSMSAHTPSPTVTRALLMAASAAPEKRHKLAERPS